MRDQFISRSPSRRECWKGHENKASVRRVIAYAERHPWVRDLRIYAVGADAGNWVTYTEIPAEQWGTVFNEGEGEARA